MLVDAYGAEEKRNQTHLLPKRKNPFLVAYWEVRIYDACWSQCHAVLFEGCLMQPLKIWHKLS
ncbi:hypothetical protein KCP77_24995 (plasmid) [Salmonella enterica subsp. enterica]|nr:hypothetical protein KCP77_24995 [Salmonella enterica subsp. enterica]